MVFSGGRRLARFARGPPSHCGVTIAARLGRRRLWRDGGKSESEKEDLGEQMADHCSSIQIAMPTIARFSVSETKPSGTLLLPPTQAHLIARLSI